MDRQEAIQIVKNNWPNGRNMLSEALELLIPELKESEDERIRKEILDCFRTMKQQGCFPSKHKEQYDSWITWLEKQGEQNPTWSKEDYDEMGVIACHLDNMGNEAMANSLLCIRGKYNNVKPKQKYEWSEKDEEVFHCLEYTVKHYYDDKDTINKCCSWLKSLKRKIKGE